MKYIALNVSSKLGMTTHTVIGVMDAVGYLGSFTTDSAGGIPHYNYVFAGVDDDVAEKLLRGLNEIEGFCAKYIDR